MADYIVFATISPEFRSLFGSAAREAQAGKTYTLPPDMASSRQKHYDYLNRLKREGKLYCAGPFSDLSAAVLIFKDTTKAGARRLIQGDPYWTDGHFTALDIREWAQRF